MNAKHPYANGNSTSLTRIEMLLALYDAALDRIGEVRRLKAEGQALKSEAALLRAQRIVLELFAGLRKDESELTRNLAGLYLFVLDCLSRSPAPDLDSAERVLRTLRSGWQAIAPQAKEMELRGEIPSVGDQHSIELSA